MNEEHHVSVTDTWSYIAQRLIPPIISFVEEFESRNSLSKLREIINTSTQLTRNTVGQRPETFTEKHLIRPIIEALGYSIHRKRPGEYTSRNRSEPDFSIQSPEVAYPYIVEAKRIGRRSLSKDPDQGQGSKQLQKYLKENFSTKYRTDLDREYIVGIATDGVDWIVFAKSLDTGTIKLIDYASINETIQKTIQAFQYSDAIDDDWRSSTRTRRTIFFDPPVEGPSV